MNKLAKGFLIAFAAIGAFIVVAILTINLYVESEGVQARLETVLSGELRMPVKLAHVQFSPWRGLRLVGFTIPAEPAVDASAQTPTGQPGEPSQPAFLDSPEVAARILWRPLLSGRLVIRELLISKPTVVWTQSPKGKWRLPKFERAKANLAAIPGVSEPEGTAAGVPEPSVRPSASPNESTVRKSPSPKKLEFAIQTARIEDATFRFLDRDGLPMALFEGVTVTCPTAGVGEARGAVTIRKATFRDAMVVENLSSPFSFADHRLILPQIDARVAGGSLQGAYTLEPEENGAPFTLDLLVDGVDVNRLLAELNPDSVTQQVSGTLQGSLDLYGKHGQKKSLGGRGQIALRGGRMEQYPLLQMIGQALQIDELTRLELQQAQLDLRVGEGKVWIDSLVLESPNLSITAAGKTGVDGKQLDLAAGLTVDSKISRRLPGWVQSNFQPVEDSDRKIIHFHVAGTVSRPETDLMRVLVGQKIEKQVIDVFRILSGGSRHKKKPDKTEDKKHDSQKSTEVVPGASVPQPSPAPSVPAEPVPSATPSSSESPQPTPSPES